MTKRSSNEEHRLATRSEAAERSAATSSQSVPEYAPEIGPEDFYYEGPYMVFTAAYHRKRGYCCNSDCRHCPYR